MFHEEMNMRTYHGINRSRLVEMGDEIIEFLIIICSYSRKSYKVSITDAVDVINMPYNSRMLYTQRGW